MLPGLVVSLTSITLGLCCSWLRATSYMVSRHWLLRKPRSQRRPWDRSMDCGSRCLL